MVANSRDRRKFSRTTCSTSLFEEYLPTEVIFPKHLIHHRPDAVDIFVADLHKDGTRLGEEIAGDGKAVAEVGKVAVYAVAPSVAEGFDLFRLAGDVVGLVFHVSAGGGPLEVAVELDAVGRVEVDALDLAAQALAL